MIRLATPLLILSLLSAGAVAQEMSFEQYDPVSTLVVPAHPTPRTRYPFIDVHSHQRASQMTEADVAQVVRDMDAMNMRVMVNLSGGSGEDLAAGIAKLAGAHPGRFVVFANADLSKIDEPGFGEAAASQLARDVTAGAKGLKIYKNLGMFLVDASGKRVPTDDPRLDPIWRKAGELGIPVLIHTGEPSPFWSPFDEKNERWLELKQYPNRRRDSSQFASFEQTMAEQHNLFRRHPGTTFINAHLGWLGNDLARLGRLMDELPNMYTEIGAVLAELGRQPRMAREFLIRYQDRVLFGKDSWAPSEYPVYFRTLETADEYFDYYRRRHAHWKMYGLDLPDPVLRKIYYGNALRIIPGIDRTGFPVIEARAAAGGSTTVIVTRHAEKSGEGGADPELSTAGAARAQALADAVGESAISAIYTTQYKRTRLTAEPLARSLGVAAQTVTAGAEIDLARRILREHRGETVLVVGHSNTVGTILRELGSPTPVTLEESDYGDLFILTVPEEGTPALVRLRY